MSRMTTSYQVSKSTRTCAATGREIEQGETYVSVLVQPLDSEVMSRVDYSLEAWDAEQTQRPQPGTIIAFWRTKLTTGQSRRPLLIDDPGLVELFAALGDDDAEMSELGLVSEEEASVGDSGEEGEAAAAQARLDETRRSLRFVLALLLMRKRLLMPADTENIGDEDAAHMTLKPRGLARQTLGDDPVTVEDPQLSDAQVAEVAASLQRLFGADDAVASDGASA